ncbi:Hypothetical predicted protein [Podarcis lilfordi]|uniref:Uncharacterized protein n=1 Tax=Podarcis lilfordi TaxID=74358 RepID=A0AA35LNE1_9SAUR|nr:Hypothetical predicted protein [Podarcis lilfordi]
MIVHVGRVFKVTLGKVLKVIVIMRSLFIYRTIVKGYHENVYTEDGKIYMPGILNNPTDLAQVEYLYFNGFLARAVVSFCEGRLAKQVYKCGEQLETSGIRISRNLKWYKNEAPPIPLIPHIVNLPKTQHEIDQNVLIDINSAEDISKHPTGLVAKDSQRLDSLGPRYAENQGIDLDSFDNNLLYSYSVLPQEVQKEILHKIDTLYFCLTKVTEEQLRLPKQNMLDRDCGSDSVPRLYHQELDLWVGKAPTPTSQLVVAEMNPLFHILEAETLPPDPSTMHPISEANMTTTSAWDKMRELNESELGSPCKVPHMTHKLLTCNFINPLSSNVCKLNKSIDTIEPITEPAEPDQQMRDGSILFLAPKNDLVEDPTGRINKIIQTINDHSTSGTIPVDLNSLSLSNTPLIPPSGSEKSTILGLTSAFSETSGKTLQPNHPNKSKQLGYSNTNAFDDVFDHLPIWPPTDPDEILNLISKLKIGKAPGPDLVPAEAIKLHSDWNKVKKLKVTFAEDIKKYKATTKKGEQKVIIVAYRGLGCKGGYIKNKILCLSTFTFQDKEWRNGRIVSDSIVNSKSFGKAAVAVKRN